MLEVQNASVQVVHTDGPTPNLIKLFHTCLELILAHPADNMVVILESLESRLTQNEIVDVVTYMFSSLRMDHMPTAFKACQDMMADRQDDVDKANAEYAKHAADEWAKATALELPASESL